MRWFHKYILGHVTSTEVHYTRTLMGNLPDGVIYTCSCNDKWYKRF